MNKLVELLVEAVVTEAAQVDDVRENSKVIAMKPVDEDVPRMCRAQIGEKSGTRGVGARGSEITFKFGSSEPLPQRAC